jgi:hypothetical protein
MRRAAGVASFPALRSFCSLGRATCALLFTACTSTGPAPACSKDKVEASQEDKVKPPLRAPQASAKAPVLDHFERRGVVVFENSAGLAAALPKAVTRSEVASLVLPLPAGNSFWVALDQHPARQVGVRKLHLADLLNEDEELAPGFHHLVVLKEETVDKILLAVHPFSLDVQAQEVPEVPACILFTPQLTLNGPLAADSLGVLAVPLLEEVERVRMKANGPGLASEALVPTGTRVGLSKPPSGDFTFVAECLSGNDTALVVERTITINRDSDLGAQTK